MPSKATPAAASPISAAAQRRVRLASAEREVRYKELYTYLVGYICAHGYQPTMREIADQLGYFSQSGAQKLLLSLERAGYLKVSDGNKKFRAVKILRDPDGNEFPGFMVSSAWSDDDESRRP